MLGHFHQKILRLTPASFEETALQLFRWQAKENQIFNYFLNSLNIDFEKIRCLSDIRFLPIELFKTHDIRTGAWQNPPEAIFTSSGTTGATTSRHALQSLAFYEEVSALGFQKMYGDLKNYCILALLPSYLERGGSSLVQMVHFFIKRSKWQQSGFFLHNLDDLVKILIQNKQQNVPTLLVGVSFALLELAEKHPMPLGEQTIVMETGGMKGRRRELTRTELHDFLKRAFELDHIHSEYGMTELLSQAYAKSNGIFQPSPTMRVVARELNDPFSQQKYGKLGVLNVIDLANIDSCSFIATDDLCVVHENGTFEILGRLDGSDLRGCNLMHEGNFS